MEDINLSQETIAEKLIIHKVDFSILSNKLYTSINDIFEILPTIVLGILIFISFYIMARVTRSAIVKIMRNRRHYNVALVLARLSKWALILLGFLVSLAVIFPSITSVDLLAGLGIGGVALSFAFKDILHNYLSGILILLHEPFRIGDEIKYNDVEGTVESIDTRATLLKSFDGIRILIPNGEIYKTVVEVNTAFAYSCTEYDIGIGCNDDIEKASNIILAVLKSTEGIQTQPEPEVLTVALSDFNTQLRVRWWTSSRRSNIITLKSTVLKKIKIKLFEEGIDIPFPTQVVLYHDQTEETDGDRSNQREGWPPGKNPPNPKNIATAIKQAAGENGAE